MVKFPFTETTKNGKKTRVFSRDVKTEELVWHRDAKDRVVTVLKSSGWFFQVDNELPIEMKPGDKLSITKEHWHRIAKVGLGELIVEIEEL